MIRIERCSCNALAVAWGESAIQRWRDAHRHDGPDEASEPMIHESGSSHERAETDFVDYDRSVPLGFRPNP